MVQQQTRLVLASASPRRKELMLKLGLKFEVRPAAIDEQQLVAEPPIDYVMRLACAKANVIAKQIEKSAVLGADTIVVVDDQVLGKPSNSAHARQMLSQLQGRSHLVFTGLALADSEKFLKTALVQTRVFFAALSQEQIAAYVACAEGNDKAGAYAIQGMAAGFVERIEGSYTNVVGLPTRETLALLIDHGVVSQWP